MEQKTLVVYFSATGTTEPLAEYAAEILDADIYEIVPEVPYTKADLAYYTNGRADQEQNDSSARPPIVDSRKYGRIRYDYSRLSDLAWSSTENYQHLLETL